MSEHLLSRSSLDQVWGALQDELASAEGNLIVTIKAASTGKWGMSRLWYKWMSETAKYMAACGVTMPLYVDRNGNFQGRRPFNEKDAHELFSKQWLGVDEQGNRLSWSKGGNSSSRAATKSERFHALRLHDHWCLERGIQIFRPRDSEYDELARSMNE